MERIVLTTRLRPGMETEYERVHASIPPELDSLLRLHGVQTWEIYRNGLDLVHIVECEDYTAFIDAVRDDPVNVAWQMKMAALLDVVHDYGARESNALRLVWELPR